jgi:hypothetical protein
VKVAVVEGEDLCAGVAEEDGGVGGDEELGVFVAAEGVVDEDEEGELALSAASGSSRRKRPLRVNLCRRSEKKLSPCDWA